MTDNPIFDRLRAALDLPPGVTLHEPQHADPDGPTRSWRAADFTEHDYTDDDYAAQFPEADRGTE